MNVKVMLTAIGAVLLASAAAFAAMHFRALPPPTTLQEMTWDAAQHALIGIDVFDHIRRLEPLQLVLRMQAEHWWPPLFGVLSLPAWLIGGRELSSPSLVSLWSYCLVPAFILIGVRRVADRGLLIAIALSATFWMQSPQMMEMSAWSMLELAATLFAVASCALFAGDRHSRARNWAYGLAGASLLLKYHYGFFLLVTFGMAVVCELDRDERRAFFASAFSRLRAKRVFIPLAWLVALVVARRVEEAVSSDPKLPGVPTLIWIFYFVALVVAAIRRDATRRLWSEVPEHIRRFVRFGLIWPMITFLDPSKVQAWYRQLRVVTDPPATFAIQLSELRRYLTDDYFLGLPTLIAAAIGVALCIAFGLRRRRVDIVAVGLHGLWPIALMTLSKYRIESRFLATMIGVAMFAAVLGWTLLVAGRTLPLRVALTVAIAGALLFDRLPRAEQWNAILAKRRVYGYMSSDPPHGFVVATVHAMSRGEPVLIVLPRDIEVVSPTIRLGLRTAMPDVSPHHVVVRGGDEKRFVERLRRFDRGLVATALDEAALRRIAGTRLRSIEQGPTLPDGARRLLIARVE